MVAIKTSYGGYRFRSRLEARWAIFFDALGVEWRYEPEGFNLDGVLYLPDFWLPNHRMWAEVKPERLSDAECEKCRRLAAVSGRPVLELVDHPSLKAYWAWQPIGNGARKNDLERVDYALTNRSNGTRFFANPDTYLDLLFGDSIKAVTAARSALFDGDSIKGALGA